MEIDAQHFNVSHKTPSLDNSNQCKACLKWDLDSLIFIYIMKYVCIIAYNDKFSNFSSYASCTTN